MMSEEARKAYDEKRAELLKEIEAIKAREEDELECPCCVDQAQAEGLPCRTVFLVLLMSVALIGALFFLTMLAGCASPVPAQQELQTYRSLTEVASQIIRKQDEQIDAYRLFARQVRGAISIPREPEETQWERALRAHEYLATYMRELELQLGVIEVRHE